MPMVMFSTEYAYPGDTSCPTPIDNGDGQLRANGEATGAHSGSACRSLPSAHTMPCVHFRCCELASAAN